MLLALAGFLIMSCGETKTLTSGNYLFRYKDNHIANTIDSTIKDSLYIYQLSKPLKSKIDDKTTYQVIKTNPTIKDTVKTIKFPRPLPDKVKLNGVVYTPEVDIEPAGKYFRSLTYFDTKFALQALTIPLKFRNQIGDGSKYPSQVETGVNIGFAPTIKFNYNVFNPIKKTMGKLLNTYSINTGILLNLGSTALKAATNAPGLPVDRTSATFTYGTFVLFGINNINFGYAVGLDNVLGDGHKYWVYQNKLWQGIVISLDIVKP
ncbi:hypothetical protein [Mucilaginibacter sp.]|uniref:hypothetical protein n=1 Tax=Mucilaginibacter sp. TaxID=1882438 RepID=UPI0026003154|nr:hypothetical protein [Mucilaginibacter sp.]